jgi:hypothetical protein
MTKEEKKEQVKQYNKEYRKKHYQKLKEIKKKWRESEEGKEICRLNQKRFRDSQNGKDYRLRYNYGISLEDYNLLLMNQQHSCKICGKEFQLDNPHDIHVDHDYTTGKVRGLLCQKCNMAIGLFNDDINKLLTAIKYLEDNR